MCRSRLSSSLVSSLSARFRAAAVSEPDNSARLLVEAVVGQNNNKAEDALDDKQIQHVENMALCRLSHMPVQYILGEWDFRDLRLKTRPPVFIPRPETEQLIDVVLRHVRQRGLQREKRLKMLEIGCGTGAISLSLLKSLPNLTSLAVDRSATACALAAENAAALGLIDRLDVAKARLSNDGSLEGGVDVGKVGLVVSNPPYVPTARIRSLQPEIKLYEDLRALDGGTDGSDLVKAVLLLSARCLETAATAHVELDETHAEAVADWVKGQRDTLGLEVLAIDEDFAGKKRFLSVAKTE